MTRPLFMEDETPDPGPLITLKAFGPQAIGKTLLLDAIAEFLNTDEVKAGPALTKFRSVYGPKVVVLTEVQT